jgi:hypothetical protein
VEEAQRWVGDDTQDPEILCKRIRKLGPKAVALTDGRRGAYSYSDEGFYYIPEFPGERVEATGAGDSFTTAYIAALINGKTHKEALTWGPINAGSVVKFVGPLAGLLKKNELIGKMKSIPRYKPVAIVDLKTTSTKPGASALGRAVLDYGYDLSAAHYLAVAELAGLDADAFAWVFVDKADTGPRVTVAEPDAALLERGRVLRARALARAAGTLPAYEGATGYLTLTCPAWAQPQEEMEGATS